MGSRKAVTALAAHATQRGVNVTYKPCKTTMSFADGKTETLTECCVLTFPTVPPVQTTIDIHESGNVPVLMSLPQMMNLEMNLYLRSSQVYCTCDALGMHETPLDFSTSKHVVLDLCAVQWVPYEVDRNRTFMTQEQLEYESFQLNYGDNTDTPVFP